MKQMLLIVNPVAGQKKAAKNLAEIIEIFNRADYEVKVYITSQDKDAEKIAGFLKQPLDLVVCCGGDGTLNATVNVILQENRNIPIGYIPAGSTNDFASSLRLPTNILKAAKAIVEGTPRRYDLGQFGERYFAYVASFGAFTRTSYSTPQSVKNALGHMAYLLEGIQELSQLKKIHVRLELDEGRVIEDDFLFGAISNSTSVGGILTLDPKQVDMSDGKFELLLVRSPQDIGEVSECLRALQTQKYNCRMVTFLSTSHVRITANADMIWTLDGERGGGYEVVEAKMLHHALQLIMKD